MSPDIVFTFTLAIKMAVTAAFVVVATVTAERAGAAVGALVATLPISAGPAYVFLALDHDPAFISASALSTLVINAATIVFAAIYVLLAQRQPLAISFSIAIGIWVALSLMLNGFEWTLFRALVFNIVVFAFCVLAVQPYREASMPRLDLRWTDMVFRGFLVACLVAAVVTLSFHIGASATGVLAGFPIVFTSIMLLLNPRIGGHATAAVLANAVLGLAGFGFAVLTLHVAAVPLGSAAALILALTVSILWNLGVHAVRQYGIRV